MPPRVAPLPNSSRVGPTALVKRNAPSSEAHMNLLIELLAFAVAIGVLVVVHEYGHYSVARLCGVKGLRFSIGFGKPLFQWVSPKTGTEWTIAALPLGGYVKMLDEREAGAPIPPEALPYAFNRQHVAKRFAIVAAGGGA